MYIFHKNVRKMNSNILKDILQWSINIQPVDGFLQVISLNWNIIALYLVNRMKSIQKVLMYDMSMGETGGGNRMEDSELTAEDLV